MSEKSGLEKSLSASQTAEGRLAPAEDENAFSACFSPRPALFPLSTEEGICPPYSSVFCSV